MVQENMKTFTDEVGWPGAPEGEGEEEEEEEEEGEGGGEGGWGEGDMIKRKGGQEEQDGFVFAFLQKHSVDFREQADRLQGIIAHAQYLKAKCARLNHH